jgi:hypothetical protein
MSNDSGTAQGHGANRRRGRGNRTQTLASGEAASIRRTSDPSLWTTALTSTYAVHASGGGRGCVRVAGGYLSPVQGEGNPMNTFDQSHHRRAIRSAAPAAERR